MAICRAVWVVFAAFSALKMIATFSGLLSRLAKFLGRCRVSPLVVPSTGVWFWHFLFSVSHSHNIAISPSRPIISVCHCHRMPFSWVLRILLEVSFSAVSGFHWEPILVFWESYSFHTAWLSGSLFHFVSRDLWWYTTWTVTLHRGLQTSSYEL